VPDILSSVVEFLHGEGAPAEGLEGDLHRAEAYAILHFNGRPYCLVKDWIIAEVTLLEDLATSLASDGLAPCVLYAPVCAVCLQCSPSLCAQAQLGRLCAQHLSVP